MASDFETTETAETAEAVSNTENGRTIVVDFTETLANVQPRPVFNVEASVPPRVKRRTPRSLRVKAASKLDAGASSAEPKTLDASNASAAESNTLDASNASPAEPKPLDASAQTVETPAAVDNAPAFLNAPPQETEQVSAIDAETSFDANVRDALTAFAATVEPDRSFYFSESTENARSAPRQTSPTVFLTSTRSTSTLPSVPTPTSAEAPAQAQRAQKSRLTILQRFVKLVAQNQAPVVASPREPQTPKNFGENVAFVVSPSALSEPTTQPVDAAFPFVVDAFEPASQDYFSYF